MVCFVEFGRHGLIQLIRDVHDSSTTLKLTDRSQQHQRASHSINTSTSTSISTSTSNNTTQRTATFTHHHARL
jgi:hypothetical protein